MPDDVDDPPKRRAAQTPPEAGRGQSEGRVEASLVGSPPPPRTEPARTDGDDDLPVVARLVVEIRSDGSRTVARGALEENTTGQSVAVRAEGTTPLALSLQLARSLASLPGLARQRARQAIAAKTSDGDPRSGDEVDPQRGAPLRPRFRRPRLRRTLRRLLRGDDDDRG